jgi:hypothetical protein
MMVSSPVKKWLRPKVTRCPGRVGSGRRWGLESPLTASSDAKVISIEINGG